jgi:asparagine synthase (glutamine-hydrolysing)
MLAAQALYGPHDVRTHIARGVAMGRRLFRLFAEDAFDRQPLIGGGGRFTLVADCRLDNRDELARSLGIDRPRLATLCDADLILAAYEKWQAECCAHLLGDFAFALWDAPERRLVLARDPVGARPLHYWRRNGAIAFASMPKGLLALPDVERAPDLVLATQTLLHRSFAGDRSYYEGISRVRPGHILTLDDTGVQDRRYWNPAPAPLRLPRHQDYVEAMRAHLDDAVRYRLRGATAVAAHLSAGLDSQAVATAAALQLDGMGMVTAFTGVPRQGFAATHPRALFDEGPLAAATAARYPNMTHVRVEAPPASAFADLDRNAWLADQPVPNMCNMPWWNAINDSARDRGFQVLLTGETGNIAFSYDGMDHFAALLRSGRLMALAAGAVALHRSGFGTTGNAVRRAVQPALPPAIRALLARARGAGPRTGAHPDLLAKAAATDPARSPILRYFDRADPGAGNKSRLAGWGLDHRDPTADRRLIEFALSVPTDQFLHRGEPRALARGVLSGRAAPEVLAERRRAMQGADWHERALIDRDAIAGEIELMAAHGPTESLFDIARLRELATATPERWTQPEASASYRSVLLPAIALGRFVRQAAAPQSEAAS